MLKLEVVTPEKRVVDAEVDSVTVPTASGEVGVLPNHAPLVSAVKPGILSYSAKSGPEKLVVSGGFLEISSDMVSVLVDSAEAVGEIDVDAARARREEAERTLGAGASTVEEMEPVREELDLALARLSAAGK